MLNFIAAKLNWFTKEPLSLSCWLEKQILIHQQAIRGCTDPILYLICMFRGISYKIINMKQLHAFLNTHSIITPDKR